MYRVNPLYRNVLITVDEVIFHAPTKHTLDPRTIENSIIVAEERIIRASLGYDFYMALLDSKNKVVTDENRSDLQTKVSASLADGADPVTLANGDIVNAMEFLSEDNQALWKQHLWKLTAECVLLAAYPEGFVQFGSDGVHHAQSTTGPMSGGGTVTPELRTMKWAMDKKMMDRIDPLRESMHLWLCKQQKAYTDKYPNYDKACDCDADGVAYKRKSNFVLGLYDEEDGINNDSCCE